MFRSLLKTLPSLTGNFKIACKVDHFDKKYKENGIKVFEVNITKASLQPLQNKIFNRDIEIGLINGKYEYDVQKYYNKYLNTFYNKNYSYNVNDFKYWDEIHDESSSRNKDYEFGCKRISYFNTGYQFEFFCPIYIDDHEDLPTNFDIIIKFNQYFYKKIRINLNINNSKNYLYRYLNTYLRKIDNKVIFMNNYTYQATYFGIDVKNGGFVAIENNIKLLYKEQLPINEFNKTLNKGFENNNLIIRQILPLSFQFNIFDLLDENEKKIFSFTKVENIWGAFYNNALELPFYDINTNHDELYGFRYKYKKSSNSLIRELNDINVLNIDSVFSLKEKYLKEYLNDKITPNYNHWELSQENKDLTYYTNFNINYTKPNLQYGDYPNINSLYQIFLSTSNQNNIDIKDKKDTEENIENKEYEYNIKHFCNSWYSLIDSKNMDDIFDNEKYWSILTGNYSYYKGILYNLNNLINENKIGKIDYFGIFLDPNLNILDTNNAIQNIKTIINKNYTNSSQNNFSYNIVTNQYEPSGGTNNVYIKNDVYVNNSTYDFENKTQYIPFYGKDKKYINIYELKNKFIELSNTDEYQDILLNPLYLFLFCDKIDWISQPQIKLNDDIIGFKEYQTKIYDKIIDNDYSYILLENIYSINNILSLIKNYDIYNNLYYKYIYDINKILYSSNPITFITDENIEFFIKAKFISEEDLANILEELKNITFNNNIVFNEDIKNFINNEIIDNLYRYTFIYDENINHYFKKYDKSDIEQYDIYFDYRFARNVIINNQNIKDYISSGNHSNDILKYGMIQVLSESQFKFVKDFANEYDNHLENSSREDLLNGIEDIYNLDYYYREYSNGENQKFSPEFPLYLYFSIPVCNYKKIENDQKNEELLDICVDNKFGYILYDRLLDYLKPHNQNIEENINFINLEDIEYYDKGLFKLNFFKTKYEYIKSSLLNISYNNDLSSIYPYININILIYNISENDDLNLELSNHVKNLIEFIINDYDLGKIKNYINIKLIPLSAKDEKISNNVFDEINSKYQNNKFEISKLETSLNVLNNDNLRDSLFNNSVNAFVENTLTIFICNNTNKENVLKEYFDNHQNSINNTFYINLRSKYNKYYKLENILFNIYYNAPLCKVNQEICENITSDKNKAYYLVYNNKYNYFSGQYILKDEYDNDNLILNDLTKYTDDNFLFNLDNIYYPLYNNPYKEEDEIEYQKNLINDKIYYKVKDNYSDGYKYIKYSLNSNDDNSNIVYIENPNPYNRYYSISLEEIINLLGDNIYKEIFVFNNKFSMNQSMLVHSIINKKSNIVKLLFFFLDLFSEKSLYESNKDLLDLLGISDQDGENMNYYQLYNYLKSTIDLPISTSLNKNDSNYILIKKIITNIINHFPYIFNVNFDINDLINNEFYNTSLDSNYVGEHYIKDENNDKKNIFDNIFINIIFGAIINNIRNKEYHNLYKKDLSIILGEQIYNTNIQILINNLISAFDKSFEDKYLLYDEYGIYNKYYSNIIDISTNQELSVIYNNTILKNGEKYQLRFKENYQQTLQIILKYLYSYNKNIIINLINKYNINLFEIFENKDTFLRYDKCKFIDNINIYERNGKRYGFMIFNPYIDNTNMIFNISNNILFDHIDEYQLDNSLFFTYFNTLVPYLKIPLFSIFNKLLLNTNILQPMYKTIQNLNLKSELVSSNPLIRQEKIDTYNMVINDQIREKIKNSQFNGLTDENDLYENYGEHQIKRSNNSKISLYRYTNFIRPSLIYSGDQIKVHNLKYKTLEYNQFGNDNIYLETNVINYYPGVQIFNDETKKVYNNDLDNAQENEFKHFNHNRWFILPSKIEITLEKKLTYDELLENETQENSLKIFKKHINKYKINDLKENELLFLFNKYNLTFASLPLDLQFNKVQKLYELKYIFTII